MEDYHPTPPTCQAPSPVRELPAEVAAYREALLTRAEASALSGPPQSYADRHKIEAGHILRKGCCAKQ